MTDWFIEDANFRDLQGTHDYCIEKAKKDMEIMVEKLDDNNPGFVEKLLVS